MVASERQASEFSVFGGSEAMRRTDTSKGHKLRSNVSEGRRSRGRLSCGEEVRGKGNTRTELELNGSIGKG